MRADVLRVRYRVLPLSKECGFIELVHGECIMAHDGFIQLSSRCDVVAKMQVGIYSVVYHVYGCPMCVLCNMTVLMNAISRMCPLFALSCPGL